MSTRPVVAERAVTARSDPLGRLRLALASVARRDLPVLTAVWIFGAAYEAHFLFRGWFPHDEGALAESAKRVLAGELPHRDFAEIYTGGLSYLHALAFLAFGEELTSMRIVLFAFFAAWVPALYAVARHFASPPVAGTCVVACIAWSVPNYSASMPSWYNLFFATFAVAFVLRYCDGRRLRWLLAAGLACGLSIDVKPTGAYVVIALLLVLLADEQARSASETGVSRSPYTAFIAASAAATIGFLVVLVHRRLGAAEAVNFIVPGSGIAALLVWNEVRVRRLRAGVRLRSFAVPVAWFGLGLAVPIVAFMAPYLVSGSLGSLFEGVLVEPAARLRFAAMKPPSLLSLPLTFLVVIAVVGLLYVLSRGRLGGRLVATDLLAICFTLAATSYGYAVTWKSIRDASLFLVPIGAVLLLRAARRGAVGAIENVRTFALLAVFAFAALIRFPFSAPIYFCYVAPLMFLALLGVGAHWRVDGRRALSPFALAALFAFLAAIGIVRVNQEFIGGPAAIGEGVPLGLSRSGSLLVSRSDARLYRHVVARIQALGASSHIYAGPDAPELYFLTGRQNPTRAEFEFLERGSTADRELLRALDRYRVSLVALNLRPGFSPPLDSHVRAVLSARYPHHERIGRFELRWRT
jgi:hypothetical protein